MNALFRFLSSLKLAVITIVGIAIALTVATFLESWYDTRTARFWVYRSFWFYGILALLGVNIFAVMVDRWPWKKRHLPFLLAHIGILMLLFGSWMTYQSGLDGSLMLEEGQSSPRVELEENVLVLIDSMKTQILPIEWKPAHYPFEPYSLGSFDLEMDQWISHAEPKIQFSKAQSDEPPAIELVIEGGPMNFEKAIWLFAGDQNWSTLSLGPAQFTLFPVSVGVDVKQLFSVPIRKNHAFFWRGKKNELHYRIYSKDGTYMGGSLSEKSQETVLSTGWMKQIKELKLRVRQWMPHALNETSYHPARVQKGPDAPPSAIHLRVKGKSSVGVWLGLGDRAVLDTGETEIQIQYRRKQVMLPFSLHLEEFKIQNYQGTYNPAMYSSFVRVIDENAPQEKIEIKMNDPLKWKGFTFFQSSYVPARPRPTISIFTVNQDPGRFMKYLGSILLVLGSALLFIRKYVGKKGKIS